MSRPQSYTFPAAVIVSILIAWIGTVAIAGLPSATTVSPLSSSKAPSGDNHTVDPNMVSNQTSDIAVKQDCSLSTKYPESILQWCRLIEQYAGVNGLQANLVAAVMLQESGGNPKAYSSAGAVGLMQVMPRDGLAAAFQCPSGPCFTRRPTMNQLFEPEFNISYGTTMLANLIQKFGSIRDGVMYYGPSGIDYRYADAVLAIQANYH